jgi:hypothetical protein
MSQAPPESRDPTATILGAATGGARLTNQNHLWRMTPLTVGVSIRVEKARKGPNSGVLISMVVFPSVSGLRARNGAHPPNQPCPVERP